MASVAIGEEAAESIMAGARGDPESVGADALRPVTEVEFPFAAVDLVVGIIETAEGEESEDGDGPRVKRTRQVHPRSDFSQAPWSIMLRKPELKQRDSREYRNFRRQILIPYEFFLELMELARDVAGRQCILYLYSSAEGQ